MIFIVAIVCLFIGASLGMAVTALCVSASNASRREEETLEDEANSEETNGGKEI